MIFAILIVAATSSSPADEPVWPQIVGLEKEYQFEYANEAQVYLTLRDENGTPKYLLECGSIFYDGNSNVYFSGDFECRLESLYSTETVSTLFAYDKEHTRDWENRALFYAEHFVGDCRRSPYGGEPRVLRLRSMKIVLEIFDEELAFEEVEGRRRYARFVSFRFRVRVSRDDDAIRHITDEIGFDDLPIWYHSPVLCLEEHAE